MNDSAPSNFCRLPGTGFSNDPDGRIRACCIYRDYITDVNGDDFFVQKSSVNEIFNSRYMKNLRQEFRENKRPSGCSTCWTNEDNGVVSKRQIYLKDTANSFNIESDWRIEPTEPSEFQMIISNSCNLKCRSCSSSHSTSWQMELKARNLPDPFSMPYKQSGDINGKLWTERSSWYKTVRRLEIVGGEPFYAKQWHQIFQELVDQGYSKKIGIGMSSNATMIFPELIDLVCKNFVNLGIGLSVDGHGKLFEYLRHSGKWETVLKNIKTYADLQKRHSNFHLHFNITISWLNAWYLPEFYELLNKEFPQLKKWNNIVHYPEHLALWAVPTSFKDAIAKKWDSTDFGAYNADFQGFKEYMYSRSASEAEFRNNIKNLQELDVFRKESVVKSLPEVAELLEIL